MRYFKISKADGSRKELTHEQAKELLSTGYTEVITTYDDMLSYEGAIPFKFCILEIKAE